MAVAERKKNTKSNKSAKKNNNTKTALKKIVAKVPRKKKATKASVKKNSPKAGDKKKKVTKSVKKETKVVVKKESPQTKKLSTRGVVYFSNLPHGFYEEELQGYLGQFGKVTGVYLPRNKKTGRSKGYAFAEFEHPEVAQVAAETMNNYLMFDRLIKTSVVPPEKQRPIMFHQKFKNKKFGKATKKAVKERNKVLKTDTAAKFVQRAKRNLEKAQNKIKALGVNYNIKTELEEEVVLTKVKGLDSEAVENNQVGKVSPNKKNGPKKKGKKSPSKKSPAKASPRQTPKGGLPKEQPSPKVTTRPAKGTKATVKASPQPSPKAKTPPKGKTKAAKKPSPAQPPQTVKTVTPVKSALPKIKLNKVQNKIKKSPKGKKPFVKNVKKVVKNASPKGKKGKIETVV